MGTTTAILTPTVKAALGWTPHVVDTHCAYPGFTGAHCPVCGHYHPEPVPDHVPAAWTEALTPPGGLR